MTFAYICSDVAVPTVDARKEWTPVNELLVPVTRVASALQYDLQGLPGATEHALLAAGAQERLLEAQSNIEQFAGRKSGFRLLIWDAFRTVECQRAIFDRRLNELQMSMSEDQAYLECARFVTPPQTVFPHGTGGAVDLTLMRNGLALDLGPFDEFDESAAADYFLGDTPVPSALKERAELRHLLRSAMEQAGFVVLPEEWWHFEWGTERWASATGQTARLPRLLTLDEISRGRMAAARPNVQSSRQRLIAPSFDSPRDRAASLAHISLRPYYARAGHDRGDSLASAMTSAFDCPSQPVLTSSGLSACVALFEAVVPPEGVLVYDKKNLL